MSSRTSYREPGLPVSRIQSRQEDRRDAGSRYAQPLHPHPNPRDIGYRFPPLTPPPQENGAPTRVKAPVPAPAPAPAPRPSRPRLTLNVSVGTSHDLAKARQRIQFTPGPEAWRRLVRPAYLPIPLVSFLQDNVNRGLDISFCKRIRSRAGREGDRWLPYRAIDVAKGDADLEGNAPSITRNVWCKENDYPKNEIVKITVEIPGYPVYMEHVRTRNPDGSMVSYANLAKLTARIVVNGVSCLHGTPPLWVKRYQLGPESALLDPTADVLTLHHILLLGLSPEVHRKTKDEHWCARLAVDDAWFQMRKERGFPDYPRYPAL